MKNITPAIVAVLIPGLLLQSCVGNLADDAFAHAVKSGNSRAAVSTIQPGQARLHIYEQDGRWYYPIQYTIARGDAESTFGLIRSGSPTTLDGRSLAYNAARVNRAGLARTLASSGYGTHSDISQALADNRREHQRSREMNNAAAALGVIALFSLMNSQQNSGDFDDSEVTYNPYTGEPMGKLYYR